jgi:hypothetical protein
MLQTFVFIQLQLYVSNLRVPVLFIFAILKISQLFEIYEFAKITGVFQCWFFNEISKGIIHWNSQITATSYGIRYTAALTFIPAPTEANTK